MSDNLYLQRYAYPKRLIQDLPSKNLGIVIVIPCYCEPDLLGSLRSIAECASPRQDIEVIVILNQSENASPEVHNQNEKTWLDAKAWSAQHNSGRLKYWIVWEKDLPQKHAGVGLARKIGMDEAVRRLEEAENPQGIIVGYDADCRCDPNYLQALEDHFRQNPKSPGCSIYFEHPLEGSFSEDLLEGIIRYELFLRYYVNTLQFAGYPFAAQTIGSAMAVRSTAYQKKGGMNKRKAGEDFYFLNKIMALGNYSSLNTTKVIPSPRKSHRVPFGTGRAMEEWLKGKILNAYALSTFIDLKFLLDTLDGYYDKSHGTIETRMGHNPESIRSFFAKNSGVQQLRLANNQSSSLSTFRKRFWQWFDGLRVLQYIHHSRDYYYPSVPVAEAASQLAMKLGISDGPISDARTLLLEYRKFDRNQG